METKAEIYGVEKTVRDILRNDTRARNDDKYLTFRVMQQVLTGDHAAALLSISLSDLIKMPAFETVKRTRARIQNVEHLFLPTAKQVRHRRRIREDVFAEYAAGQTKSFL